MTDLLDATDVTPVFDPEVRRGPDPQPDPTVRVRSEPLTYERLAPRSYIRDLVLAETQGDIAARSRLKRHAIEMETRVNPSRVDGLGGYFSPPAWLESHYEKARRPIRTLANLIDAQDRLFPLPPGVQSLNIPLLTTGTQANGPADLEPVDDVDFVDTSKSSTVATISGQSDVALQLLEQSPPGAHLDMAILDDLHAAYDAELNSMMYYGNATNDPGQFNGLNTVVASPNVITYTNATPVLTGMYAYLGQAFAQVGDNRSLPPTHVTMRSARWAWIASSEDSSLRPIVPPDLAPPWPRTTPTAPSAPCWVCRFTWTTPSAPPWARGPTRTKSSSSVPPATCSLSPSRRCRWASRSCLGPSAPACSTAASQPSSSATSRASRP